MHPATVRSKKQERRQLPATARSAPPPTTILPPVEPAYLLRSSLPPPPAATVSATLLPLSPRVAPRPPTSTFKGRHIDNAPARDAKPLQFQHGFGRIGMGHQAPILFELDQRHLKELCQTFHDNILEGDSLLQRTVANPLGKPLALNDNNEGGGPTKWKSFAVASSKPWAASTLDVILKASRLHEASDRKPTTLEESYTTEETPRLLTGVPPDAAISLRYRLGPWRGVLESWVTALTEERRIPSDGTSSGRSTHATATALPKDVALWALRSTDARSKNPNQLLQIELMVQCVRAVTAHLEREVDLSPKAQLHSPLPSRSGMTWNNSIMSPPMSSSGASLNAKRGSHIERFVLPLFNVPHCLTTSSAMYVLVEHLSARLGGCRLLFEYILQDMLPVVYHASALLADPLALSGLPLQSLTDTPLGTSTPRQVSLRYLHATHAAELQQYVPLLRVAQWRVPDKVVLRKRYDRLVMRACKGVMRRFMISVLQNWHAVAARQRSLRTAVVRLFAATSEKQCLKDAIGRWRSHSFAVHAGRTLGGSDRLQLALPLNESPFAAETMMDTMLQELPVSSPKLAPRLSLIVHKLLTPRSLGGSNRASDGDRRPSVLARFNNKVALEQHASLSLRKRLLEAQIVDRGHLIGSFEYNERCALTEQLQALDRVISDYQGVVEAIGTSFRNVLDVIFPLVFPASNSWIGEGDSRPGTTRRFDETAFNSPARLNRLIEFDDDAEDPMSQSDLAASCLPPLGHSLQGGGDDEYGSFREGEVRVRKLAPLDFSAAVDSFRHRNKVAGKAGKGTAEDSEASNAAAAGGGGGPHFQASSIRMQPVLQWLTRLAQLDRCANGSGLGALLQRYCAQPTAALTLGVVSRTTHLQLCLRLVILALAPPLISDLEFRRICPETTRMVKKLQARQGPPSTSVSRTFEPLSHAHMPSSSFAIDTSAAASTALAAEPTWSILRRASSTRRARVPSLSGPVDLPRLDDEPSESATDTIHATLDEELPELREELSEFAPPQASVNNGSHIAESVFQQQQAIRRMSGLQVSPGTAMLVAPLLLLPPPQPELDSATTTKPKLQVAPDAPLVALATEGSVNLNNSPNRRRSKRGTVVVTEPPKPTALPPSDDKSAVLAQDPTAASTNRRRSLAAKLHLATMRASLTQSERAGGGKGVEQEETFSQRYRRLRNLDQGEVDRQIAMHRKKSIEIHRKKSEKSLKALETAAISLVGPRRRSFLGATPGDAPLSTKPSDGEMAAAETTSGSTEEHLIHRRTVEVNTLLEKLPDCPDATSVAQFLLRLMNRITRSSLSKGGVIRVFPNTLGRHVIHKDAKDWRALFLAALHFTQVGATCMAFHNIVTTMERRFIGSMITAQVSSPLFHSVTSLNNNTAAQPLRTKGGEGDGEDPHPHAAARYSEMNPYPSHLALDEVPHYDLAPTSSRGMFKLLRKRRQRRKEVSQDIAEQNANTIYHDIVREISTKAFYGIEFQNSAMHVYRQYCAASADILNSQLILPSFMAAKMRIIFGPESSFWKPVTSVRAVRNAKDLEEMISTLAPLARISPTQLCDRMLAALDDTDLFFITLASTEVEDAFTACLPEIAVVFALYSSGDPMAPSINFDDWMRLNQPLYDINYSAAMAEHIFQQIARRFYNCQIQAKAFANNNFSLFFFNASLIGKDPAGWQWMDSIGLDIDSFCDALSVLVTMKFPNPFVPLEQKVVPFVETLLVPLVGLKSKEIKKRLVDVTVEKLKEEKKIVKLTDLSPQLQAKIALIRAKSEHKRKGPDVM